MPQWGSYTLGSFSGFDLELWFSLGLENTLCFVHSTIVDRCPRTEASNRRLWGKHHTWCYLGTKHCFWGVHRPCVLVHYAEILTDTCPLLGETRQVLALKKLRETYLSLMSNNGCNNPGECKLTNKPGPVVPRRSRCALLMTFHFVGQCFQTPRDSMVQWRQNGYQSLTDLSSNPSFATTQVSYL